MAIPPDPTEDPKNERPDGALASPAPARQQAQASRPVGHVGGHTVQDWEQPAPGPAVPRQAAASSPVAETQEGPVVDPSPPTTPLYLRPAAKAPGAVQETARAAEAVPFDAKAQTLTAQSAALVDAITRGLAESLATQMRPVVASTIGQLLPMLLSLGNTPESDDLEQDEAAAAPSTLGAVETDEAGQAETA